MRGQGWNVDMNSVAFGDKKRELESLETELQRVVTLTACILGSEPRSSGRSFTGVFNHSHLSHIDFISYYLF